MFLKGYNLKSEIFISENSRILTATLEENGNPVIVKILNKDYPSTKELSTFIHEYEITKKISGEKVIKVYKVEKVNNSLAIIMEDVEGDSLEKILNTTDLNISEKLLLSIKICQSLVQIHKENIIHKDINPTNIIWNRENDLLKIIDFGVSSELTREVSQNIESNLFEGTLNYISPEQTGRINRPVDFRTDLYSFGITLYEIFTGALPFDSVDDLELIFSHIAIKPIPPIELNPNIPLIISNIIMKLISKNSDERYQSALGLLRDLEYCQEAFISNKLNKLSFTLGKMDFNDRFEIPNKLYGRENEIRLLKNKCEKALNENIELLLVTGYSGIGKSTLIHEIKREITFKRGYFISGKYNQYELNTPYFALIQSFNELIKQLLKKSQEELDSFKNELLDVLGENIQVIMDLIPELEQIIGSKFSIPDLNPLEAQNRFQMSFKQFIGVFAKSKHPLVIFLDDLQWSDVPTLDLIKYILTSSDLKNLLLIGAFRDNEVFEGHHLLRLIHELEGDYSDIISQINLKPLEFSDIKSMLSDVLKCPIESIELLTNVVLKKTKGNPFFIRQMLKTLYEKKMFNYIQERNSWEYKIDLIEKVDISDNVIDLLVKSLESLSSECIEILNIASCVGNKFNITTISIISNKSISYIGKNIWSSIEKEIIIPLDNDYKIINSIENFNNESDIEVTFSFAHDKIRQAIYSLISQKDRSSIHLRIGKEYLRKNDDKNNKNEIFELVNHMNIAKDIIIDKAELLELANLNISAGNKAKKSTAFSIALNYYEIAEKLLSEDEWKLMHDKHFKLLLEQASSAMLSGDLLKADKICENLSCIATNNIEKAYLANIKVLIYIFQGKLFDTISCVRETLELFNIRLPESNEEIGQKIHEGIGVIQQFLQKSKVEEIIDSPQMNDPDKLAVMQLLFQVIPPALQVNPQLYILVSLMMFEQTIKYGTCPLSCKCLGDCGVILGTVLRDYDTGYKLGEAAFALINKFKDESQKSPVYFIFTYLSYWKVHYEESLKYYEMSYQVGLKTGDLMHATYAIVHKIHLLMWVGESLDNCKSENERTIAFLKRSKGNAPLLLAEIINYFIDKFQTLPETKSNEEIIALENDIINKIRNSHNLVFLGRFYQYNTYLNIIIDNYKEAEKWNNMAEEIIFAGLSDFPIPDHYLFRGLILVNKWSNSNEENKVKILESLEEISKKIFYWAESCPVNFAHKYYLLSAKISIIKNESLEIILNLFKKAINSIENNDFIQFKALCNELYGEFWLSKGDDLIGKSFIIEAHYLYNQWGAYNKVELMEKKYARYFKVDEILLNRKMSTKTTKRSTTKSNNNLIDMGSILKSSQAISGEIKIEKLLTILIQSLIENACAQRGFLILKNDIDGSFYIEALQDVNLNLIKVMNSIPLNSATNLCKEIVHYVNRTNDVLVINNACIDEEWSTCSYIKENNVKSLLCMPIFYQNKLKGIVYLENNLSDNVFTKERLETLKILSSQAAISIENARLYENMEEKVNERTIQLNDANDKLRELSLHDPLTNLYNRRYTFECTNSKIDQFIRSKINSINNREKRNNDDSNIGIFLIDIDHFKVVNDTYGHSAGDNVLIEISKLLTSIIRKDDILVRWGGEEFLVILFNSTQDYIEKFSKILLEKVENTKIKVTEDKIISKTCSIGCVSMPLYKDKPDLLNLEQMINLSDYALYCAKENGRNKAAYFVTAKNYIDEDYIRNYLVNLSKSTKLDNEHFKIEYVTVSNKVLF